ncbi:hypothetical protein NBRC116494_32680 [Aurantivibrio plasticivorans]
MVRHNKIPTPARRLDIAALLILTSLLFFTKLAYAEPEEQASQTLTVIDPYAEVRTGPGRGYPVFYAVEQGEKIKVLTQRPGWFEVRTANGNRGWTSTAELSRTMQASGEPADLPSVSYGDYLQRSWRAGLKAGQFIDGELDSVETFSAIVGYRILSWLEAEIEVGKFYGQDIRGSLYGANALIEPFSQWQVSPFISVGTGIMDISSQPKLAPLTIDESGYNTYSLGAHYYVGRNFLVKGEYRWFVIDTDFDTERVDAWTIGFNAFF